MENQVLILTVGLVSGLIIAFLITWLIFKQKINLLTKELEYVKEADENIINSLNNSNKKLEDDIRKQEKNFQDRLALEVRSYETKIKSLKSFIEDKKQQYENEFKIKEDNLKEKIELLENSRERLKVEFENLANKLFEENTKKSSNSLNQLLNPFKDQLNSFGKRVNDIHSEETKQRVNLLSEIKNLKELNNQISQDALNLTKALKGENKTQGDWGELILSKILEQTGLREGFEYSTQGSYTDENGKRLRPDVIVHLPQNKDIVIDSKVSLTSYINYTESQDDIQRGNATKELIKSLYTHIKGLGAKSYENIEEVKTLDFVIMFIPIEGAFMLAASEDNNLFKTAFENNIMLVSPSTLFATLRTIENIWRYEHQNENALLISKKAADLYDKFASFVNDIENIGTHLDRTQKAYEESIKKLSLGRGNLIRRSEEFIELGVKVKKKIDTQKLLGE
ncbi:DNA recombination protein RmuC [Halarcobacter mediterraneus]|uniref:DNA recombination protein RmuC n=1 Tax=Halarcobacter mediterraneus TaxID=2023153 RepID=A0A4Q1B6M0_9BACT|nr:DNA recombination protein RmuC [Halarcobacter mediterraneus]RXK14249.1 DNA recombination protein RmuC [Halarcobacter mediterraneus]